MKRSKIERIIIYLCGFFMGVVILQFMPKHDNTEHKWHAQTVHPNHYPQEIVDAYSRNISIEEQPRWFSSLCPEITLILIAMSLEDHIISVSDEHNNTIDLKNVAYVGPIDSPDIEKIKSYHCDILFSNKSTRLADLEQINKEGIQNVIFSSNSIEDIYFNIKQLALITGLPQSGLELINKIKQEIQTQQIDSRSIKSFSQLKELIQL